MADKPAKRKSKKKKPIALDAIWQNAQWIPALAKAQGVTLDPPPPPSTPPQPKHPRRAKRPAR